MVWASGQGHDVKLRGSNTQTLAVLLSLQLGWGLWLMPHVFATFGWIAGLVIVSFAGATWLSGSLYGNLCAVVPTARTLADIGTAAYQKPGHNLAAAFTAVTQMALCPVLQLAAAMCLQYAFRGLMGPGSLMPLWMAQIIIGCLVLLAAQLRYIAQISWLCYVGNAAQLAAACLLCVGLTSTHGLTHPDEPTEVVASASRGWVYQVVTLLTVVFAFSGQYAFVEVVHNMACPQAFHRVQHTAVAAIAALYLLFGSLLYATKGRAAAELEVLAVNDNTSYMPAQAVLSRITAACVLLQTLVQYIVSLQIWTSTCMMWCTHCQVGSSTWQHHAHGPADGSSSHRGSNSSVPEDRSDILVTHLPHSANGTVSPGDAAVDIECPGNIPPSVFRIPETGGSRVHRLPWLVVSLLSVLFCGVVSTLVPSLQNLVAVLASAADIMLACGVPCLYAAALLQPTPSGGHARCCLHHVYVTVFLLSVVASAGGVAVCILSLTGTAS